MQFFSVLIDSIAIVTSDCSHNGLLCPFTLFSWYDLGVHPLMIERWFQIIYYKSELPHFSSKSLIYRYNKETHHNNISMLNNKVIHATILYYYVTNATKSFYF